MSGHLERLLAEVAQPFPWLAMKDGDVVTVCTDDGEHEIVPWNEGAVQIEEVHARLIALAPDLARLLVDIFNDDGTTLRPSLLARYLEIEQRAGEGRA